MALELESPFSCRVGEIWIAVCDRGWVTIGEIGKPPTRTEIVFRRAAQIVSAHNWYHSVAKQIDPEDKYCVYPEEVIINVMRLVQLIKCSSSWRDNFPKLIGESR